MTLSLKRKIIMSILIFCILILLLLFPKLVCINEFRKAASESVSKNLNCGSVSAIFDNLQAFVSGDVSVNVSDTKKLDAIICYNTEAKRIEASLINTKKKDSGVKAFYSPGESGISTDKGGEKFYTVDNYKNNVGEVLSEFITVKSGSIIKCLTDMTSGDISEEVSMAKEALIKNRKEFKRKTLQVMATSDLSKLKDRKENEIVYKIEIPNQKIGTLLIDMISEKNGFGQSVVSLSKRIAASLDKDDTVIKLVKKDSDTKRLEFCIPIKNNQKNYFLNFVISKDKNNSHITFTKRDSGKTLLAVYVAEGENRSEHDYTVCANSVSGKYPYTAVLLGVNFGGKKYALKKDSMEDNTFVVIETTKNKDIFTLRFTKKKAPEFNIVKKEKLFETSLHEIMEIGSRISNVFD